MKREIRNIFLSTVGRFSRPKSGVYILNGHYLSRFDNKDKSIFSSFLSSCRNFSEFINIEDAVDLIDSKSADKVDGTFLAFTFDDGFDDCFYSLAPALSSFNVNACFFINPHYVSGNDDYISRFNEQLVKTSNKKPMSWKQIVKLKESGFVIGNHTLDHLRLSELDSDNIAVQILNSKRIIEEKLDVDCQYFAWPYGQRKDICTESLDVALSSHKYVFSGCDYTVYQSGENRKYFNRRHFEASWPVSHLKYFLSKERLY